MAKGIRATGTRGSVSRRRGQCPAGQPLALAEVSRPARAPGTTPDGAFDLEGFLRDLDDGKLGTLREAVEREFARRGGTVNAPKAGGKAKPASDRRTRGRRTPPRVESALTVGQERLVRAALEAGASPATIARELGIGRTSVARFARTLKAERPARS